MAKKDPKHNALEKLAQRPVMLRNPVKATLLSEGLAVIEGKEMRLTPAGQQALAAMEDAVRQAIAARPKKQARTAKAPGEKKPAKLTAAAWRAQVDRTVEDILARLTRLEARLRGAEDQAAAPTTTDLAAIKATLLDVIKELDLSRRYGGLVPIPELRRAAKAEGIDDVGVNTALEALEQDYKVDLSVAQSPLEASEREAGIFRPGRGLLYYVVRRGA